MTSTVISVEHLTKQYDLGVIGTGTLTRDLNRWWAHLRKQPDPYTRIGQKDAFERIGESILALNDVSFTIQQGEALGIIGSNGAGKSTLLKILSRVTAPTSGAVKIKGRIGSLLEIGTGFHPELTGRENVFLNGAILGMKKNEVTRKFDEIVDFAGVDKFIDTPVKRYSSGMYVRLAFAVAAHLDPEILIVDEVLAVGDSEFQSKCLAKMSDVAHEGRTVLFVSHNMVAIQKLCPTSILLRSGKIDKYGNTEETVSHYLLKQGNSFGFSSLGGVIDRKGDQSLKFTMVEILDNTWKPLKKVLSGQDLVFRFHYICSRPRQGAEVHVSFIVKDREYPLTNVNSIDSGQSNLELFETGYFDCQWPNFNLTAQTFECSLFCAIDGQIADWIEQAFKLEVVDGDFFHTGKKIGYQSKFSILHTWQSQPE